MFNTITPAAICPSATPQVIGRIYQDGDTRWAKEVNMRLFGKRPKQRTTARKKSQARATKSTGDAKACGR